MDERQPAGPVRVEAYLTSLTGASKTPGIQHLVVNATDVLFEHAGGWADIRRQVPVNDATTMMAYSMSKAITVTQYGCAAYVLLLTRPQACGFVLRNVTGTVL